MRWTGRRAALRLIAGFGVGLIGGRPAGAALPDGSRRDDELTLFVCGDVMTGRGIDQVLPYPADPRIHESFMKSALGYVELAEQANGAIPRPVEFAYIWGDALAELDRRRPDARIVNLETSITRSDDYLPKGINYRMSPDNLPCLTAAGIDCCVLANNHVLDWGRDGLRDTIAALNNAGLAHAGAGRDRAAANAPAILAHPFGGRILVFAYGDGESGIPADWTAAPGRPGVARLPDMTLSTVRRIADQVAAVKQPGDLVVASLHWGPNWGYEEVAEHRAFAHGLIDIAGVDLVHGHSSHHVKGIEVYRERLILYGCGDFLTDYEGIRGYEKYRDDLALMYFPTLNPKTGRLVQLTMTPLQMRRFQLVHASRPDAEWLHAVLRREGEKYGTDATLDDDNRLTLLWQ